MNDIEKENLITLQHAHRKISELIANKDLFTSISYTISFDENSTGLGESEFSERPSEIAVKAAATDLRHFLMPKSRILFGHLIKIVRENVPESEYDNLTAAKDKWSALIGEKSTKNSPGVKMVVNQQGIDIRNLIDLMLNGDIMHIDRVKQEKSELIALMRGNPMLGYADMIFIGTLQDMAKALIIFDDAWIKPLLKNTDTER